MTGRITDISRSLSGELRVTMTLNALPEILEELAKEDKLTIDIKKYHPRRSLDANAYAWVLIGKLAAKLNLTTTEVYRQAIRDVGDNYEIVCVQNKAVAKLRSVWESKGVGWVTDVFGSLIEGCTCVTLYYGSSVYDTAQMSRLINIIVQECKAQGIETATPAELSLMVETWNNSKPIPTTA